MSAIVWGRCFLRSRLTGTQRSWQLWSKRGRLHHTGSASWRCHLCGAGFLDTKVERVGIMRLAPRFQKATETKQCGAGLISQEGGPEVALNEV